MVLMKIKQTGRRFGGFTSVSWDSPSNTGHKYDEYAFLFSLDLKTHYPVINKNYAIFCGDNEGICFSSDMATGKEPFNEWNSGCITSSSCSKYNIPYDKVNKIEHPLTGLKDHLSTLSELEVYQLVIQ